ncbi:MAG: hypothetical protein IT423_09940, partial [Pirellulaceae bacterium]|nr:hypothetical protein [Pirellulaceae bacterium]
MSLAIKRYLACLSLVCALMAIYATAISPWLETPQRPTRLTRTSSQPSPSTDWWSHLFAADAWQNQRPMMLQTEQGTLLFQNLEELEMGTTEKRGALLRLSPLTLIVPISNDGQTAAVGDPNAAARAYQNSQLAVVVAREGADILFREAPDWTNRSTPPVIGGLLKGSIQIVGIDPHPKPNALQTGQASSTSQTNQAQPDALGATTSTSNSTSTTGPIVSWSIRTANVRIEGRRVWTTNEVELTSGNSVAVGKDLSIFLKQDLLGPNSSDNGPWGLLGHMELKSVKQVSIQLPPGGLWKDMQIGSPELTAAHAHVPARLTLLCKGVFQFDFVKSIARLSDNVRIEHRFDGETAADEFICHELNAAFDLPEEYAAPDPQAIMVGPMRLNVIDALGIDSVGPLPAQSTVQISAPNIATSLTAKRVQAQLDPRKFGQRRFVIDSHNGRSSEGSRQPQVPIAINHLGNQFHAPSLTFAPAPNGEHLGWLLATGPGDVQTAADSTMGPAVARWQSTLQMQPADAFQIVTLDGRAMIEAAERGHLSSDRINITLQSTGQPPASPAEPGLATTLPSTASQNSMSQ